MERKNAFTNSCKCGNMILTNNSITDSCKTAVGAEKNARDSSISFMLVFVR